MFPLRDNIPSRRFPVVTVVLIAINVIIFLFEVMMGRNVYTVMIMFGVIPARLVSQWQDPRVVFTLISSMYLHGGWAHLLGNMLYLWIFGDNVEDRMGRLRFFVFYTLSGVIASLLQVAANTRSPVPIIGASGAIAGVLGAYLLLYPRARVSTLILFLFIQIVWLPAVVVLGGWFLIQLFNGLASLTEITQTGGVAWWAHIGGFVAGMILLPVFLRREQKPPPALYSGDVDLGSEGRLRW